jgi:hypothetical protein
VKGGIKQVMERTGEDGAVELLLKKDPGAVARKKLGLASFCSPAKVNVTPRKARRMRRVPPGARRSVAGNDGGTAGDAGRGWCSSAGPGPGSLVDGTGVGGTTYRRCFCPRRFAITLFAVSVGRPRPLQPGEGDDRGRT